MLRHIRPVGIRSFGAFIDAGRHTLTTKAPAGASQAAPVVIHGKRSIKAGMVEEFHRHYDAYAKAMFALPGIKAVYAFADKEDPLSYWHVTFATDAARFDAARARVAQADAAVALLTTYTAPNEDDTLVLPPHVTAIRAADAAAGGSRLLDQTPVLAMAQRRRRYVPDTREQCAEREGGPSVSISRVPQRTYPAPVWRAPQAPQAPAALCTRHDPSSRAAPVGGRTAVRPCGPGNIS